MTIDLQKLQAKILEIAPGTDLSQVPKATIDNAMHSLQAEMSREANIAIEKEKIKAENKIIDDIHKGKYSVSDILKLLKSQSLSYDKIPRSFKPQVDKLIEQEQASRKENVENSIKEILAAYAKALESTFLYLNEEISYLDKQHVERARLLAGEHVVSNLNVTSYLTIMTGFLHIEVLGKNTILAGLEMFSVTRDVPI